MRLDDHFDEEFEDFDSYASRREQKGTLKTALLLASLFVLLAVTLVLYVNLGEKKTGRPQPGGSTPAAQAQNGKAAADLEGYISGETRTAEDLGFWHAYDAPADSTLPADEPTEIPTPEPTEMPDPATDGLHTLITYADGTEEWAEINPYLARNRYDMTGFVYQKPFMQYYENNTKKSFVGVDISKDQEYVDFAALKKAGVDFVMLRMGQRGYSSGELSLDENFLDNYTRAREAELDIGAYFVTAAVTTEEAKEEVDYCLASISENEITLEYPLAVSVMPLGDGKARTDNLEKMPRTNVALTFLKNVEDAGYFSLLYGDKATLMKKYSLGSMIGYDVWYAGEGDLPDYPYLFTMWQYDLDGEVDGISGGARMNICFTDYKIR
ncbi:MAG: hypothetical protein J6O73_11975 [Lachnospiraceae bacterium]|nr:hypothetical protein [Lachnospiraceae bacterium]